MQTQEKIDPPGKWQTCYTTHNFERCNQMHLTANRKVALRKKNQPF